MTAHNRMLVPTLLSLGTTTVMAAAGVAPAIAGMAAAFPEMNPTFVKLVLTVPALVIVGFSLIVGRLSQRFDGRSLLLVGLALYVVGGVAAGLAPSFGVLLGFRAVLGLGVGIIMPLSTGLVAHFFAGERRRQVMGWSTSTASLGAVVALVLAGLLAEIHWRASFAVYLLALIMLGLVYFFLPPTGTGSAARGRVDRLPARVYGYGAGVFLLLVGFYSVPTDTALFLEEARLGGPTEAGIVIGLANVLAFVAGVTISRTTRRLGRAAPPVFLAANAAGFLLLSQAHSLMTAIVGVVVFGWGFGSLLPTLFVGATNAVRPERGVAAMSLVGSMLFLGQFMSPLLLDWLAELLIDDSVRSVFLVVGSGFAGAMVVTSVYVVAGGVWPGGSSEDSHLR